MKKKDFLKVFSQEKTFQITPTFIDTSSQDSVKIVIKQGKKPLKTIKKRESLEKTKNKKVKILKPKIKILKVKKKAPETKKKIEADISIEKKKKMFFSLFSKMQKLSVKELNFRCVDLKNSLSYKQLSVIKDEITNLSNFIRILVENGFLTKTVKKEYRMVEYLKLSDKNVEEYENFVYNVFLNGKKEK